MSDQATHNVDDPQPIVTLPPLPVLNSEAPVSPRTGEPPRPALVVAALVTLLLGSASVAVTYALHWWAAANPGNYASSARLIQWVEPEPGKWLALTLEGVLAIVAAIAAGACGVAGVQAWQGHSWSRWAGVVALVLAGGVTALFDWTGLIAVGLALVGTIMLFLAPVTRFFKAFVSFRAVGRSPYRRPERIFYGRLPRYR